MKFFTTKISIFCLAITPIATLAGSTLAPPPEAFDGINPIASMRTLNEIEPRTPIITLPYAITNSGSYYLINSIAGSNGITILADNIVLDMGGFSVEGLTNSGHGITIGNDISDVIIRNGEIDEWGGYGINGSNSAQFQISNVILEQNGQGGMFIGEDSVVKDCMFIKNNGAGIIAGQGSCIKNCRANNNKSTGIVAGPTSKIIGCTSSMNNGSGIIAGIYSTIRDCIVMRNDAHGIEMDASCRAEDNNTGDNGKTTDGAGIYAPGPGGRIKDNNVTANKRGIDVDGMGNWIEGNNIIDNEEGLRVSGTGNFIIRNVVGTPLCTNATYHFQIGVSNQAAQILENLGNSFSNANPWANIRLTPNPE